MTEPELVELMHATYPRLFWYLASRLGSVEAEDVLQEVYWAAFRRLTIEEGRDPMRWLERTARNMAFNRLKGRMRRPEISLDSAIEDGLEIEAPSPVRTAPLAWLDAAMARLPPMRRASLWLREILGLTDAEVARRLHITETTVRRHVSLAHGDLARMAHEGE